MKIKNTTKSDLKILVVQQINRAYRVPLLTKLSNIPNIDLTMIYGTNDPVQPGDVGISIAQSTLPFKSIGFPIHGIRYKSREILWFANALKYIKNNFFDVVITDHYTRMLSIWPMQAIQHRRGSNIILWGIGFHQHPTPIIDIIRKVMVHHTDALLLYSEKEKLNYQKMGISPEKCYVTQNTVDIEGIDAAVSLVTEKMINGCKKKLGANKGPILIHVGRLAKNKRIDLLLNALPILIRRWENIQLVLIGDGPEKNELQSLGKRLRVYDRVHFLGAITDHNLLAPWVLASDLFVAPAQIGLMAPMCLVYGKTLVASNVTELHGPEVQVFEPGKTGLDYSFGDVDSLAKAVNKLLDDPNTRKKFAATGSYRVRKTMGPEQMLDAFLSAINFVTGREF